MNYVVEIGEVAFLSAFKDVQPLGPCETFRIIADILLREGTESYRQHRQAETVNLSSWPGLKGPLEPNPANLSKLRTDYVDAVAILLSSGCHQAAVIVGRCEMWDVSNFPVLINVPSTQMSSSQKKQYIKSRKESQTLNKWCCGFGQECQYRGDFHTQNIAIDTPKAFGIFTFRIYTQMMIIKQNTHSWCSGFFVLLEVESRDFDKWSWRSNQSKGIITLHRHQSKLSFTVKTVENIISAYRDGLQRHSTSLSLLDFLSWFNNDTHYLSIIKNFTHGS